MVENHPENLHRMLGIDGDAKVLPGDTSEVIAVTADKLVQHFKDNAFSSLNIEFEAEYAQSRTEATIESVDAEQSDDAASQIGTEQLTTWLTHPGYPYGYVLATKSASTSAEARLLKVDITGKPERSGVTELAHIEIKEVFDEASASVVQDKLAALEHEEVETLYSLIDKVAQDQETNNNQTVLFELVSDNDEAFDIGVEAEDDEDRRDSLDTIFEVNHERSARRAFRDHLGGKMGVLRLVLEHVEGDITYYADIQGQRKGRRDHEVTDLRMLALGANEGEWDRVDYLKPEASEMYWLAYEVEEVETLFDKGESVPPEIFDLLWENPDRYLIKRKKSVADGANGEANDEGQDN